MGVIIVFSLDCPLVLSLLKYRGVRTLKKKKKKESQTRNLLNSSIDNKMMICFLNLKKKKLNTRDKVYSILDSSKCLFRIQGEFPFQHFCQG